MSTITYGFAPTDSVDTPAATPAARPKGPFRRFFDRLIEARQLQADREMRRHGLLLPHELEAAGWQITSRSEDSLPFRQWR